MTHAPSHTGPRDWDADVYDQISDPQKAWAAEVLERLELAGDEIVLDAGCGTGRVTEQLIERLPRGRVIAVDASESMVESARRRLGDRADVRQGDLSSLVLERSVDLVFSNAVFHWVLDHERLFRVLRQALAEDGRLVAQCGGAGNAARCRAAIRHVAGRPEFAEHLDDLPAIWNFATPEDTERRLSEAGFGEARCWLQPKPITPEDPAGFLATAVLGPHLDRLPASSHEPFVSAVLAELGSPVVLDYVRLNIEAGVRKAR